MGRPSRRISLCTTSTLPISVHIVGQQRHHTVFALLARKDQGDGPAKKRRLPIEVTRWLNARHASVHAKVVSGELSDSTKVSMKECFRALDDDNSGQVTKEELANALRSIDYGDGEIVEQMLEDMDQDKNGEISFEEFLATAAKAKNDHERRGVAANLPLLMTAYSTRRRLQRELGPAFEALYPKPSRRNLSSSPRELTVKETKRKNMEKPHEETVDEILKQVDRSYEEYVRVKEAQARRREMEAEAIAMKEAREKERIDKERASLAEVGARKSVASRLSQARKKSVRIVECAAVSNESKHRPEGDTLQDVSRQRTNRSSCLGSVAEAPPASLDASICSEESVRGSVSFLGCCNIDRSKGPPSASLSPSRAKRCSLAAPRQPFCIAASLPPLVTLKGSQEKESSSPRPSPKASPRAAPLLPRGAPRAAAAAELASSSCTDGARARMATPRQPASPRRVLNDHPSPRAHGHSALKPSARFSTRPTGATACDEQELLELDEESPTVPVAPNMQRRRTVVEGSTAGEKRMVEGMQLRGSSMDEGVSMPSPRKSIGHDASDGSRSRRASIKHRNSLASSRRGSSVLTGRRGSAALLGRQAVEAMLDKDAHFSTAIEENELGHESLMQQKRRIQAFELVRNSFLPLNSLQGFDNNASDQTSTEWAEFEEQIWGSGWEDTFPEINTNEAAQLQG